VRRPADARGPFLQGGQVIEEPSPPLVAAGEPETPAGPEGWRRDVRRSVEPGSAGIGDTLSEDSSAATGPVGGAPML
jgi:hypothetical protein